MAEQVPSLQYPNQLAVGNLVLNRRPDGITVRVLPDRRRLLLALLAVPGYLGIGLVIAAAFVYNVGVPRMWWNLWPVLIGPVVFLAIGCHRLVGKLVWIFGYAAYEADEHRLIYTSRQLRAIVRREWPRDLITNVCHRHLRLTNRLWKSWCVVFEKRDGSRSIVAIGSAAETEFLSTALREALHLPPDPFHARDYPAPLAHDRLSRRLLPDGLWLSYGPPAVAWRWVLATAVLWACLWLWLDLSFIDDGRGPWSWCWPAGRTIATTLIVTVTANALQYRQRRRTAIGIHAGQLVVIETGIFRPCHNDWSLADLIDVRVAPDSSAKRYQLELVLSAGCGFAVLRGLKKGDLDWVEANLRVALDVARRAGTREGPSGP